MCNEIKCAIQSTVDLINININRDVQEECANRLCYRVHIAAMRMMENDECFYSLLNESCRCYETEFRSLRVEAPPQSLSFCHHAPESLARWQCDEKKVTG